ncbi:MAG TPA: sigma-70 family RNA polymerase sigma factor [Myxococcota bacterium]|nr:sigma-70 family RNA polymerase sigma factor [Myxococcota bacterium]
MASAPTDQQLLDSLDGDPAALGTLYDRYASLVYGIALASLRDPDDAADLTQEIFLRIYRHPHQYDPERGALGAFLVTMTRTRAIDRLRARGRKLRVLQHVERAIPQASPASTALERYSLQQCTERVRAALERLPQNQRRVLELAYYRGLSQSEIADDLAASLGTVKSWARRGLLALRDALGDLIE